LTSQTVKWVQSFCNQAQQSISLFALISDRVLIGQSFQGFEAPFGLDWAKDTDNHQSGD